MPFSSLFSHTPGRVRLRLFKDLLLVVLFAVGTLLLAIYLVMTEVRQELATAQISQATAHMREEISRLLEPSQQQLSILRDWGRAGDLDRSDLDPLTRRLIPTLAHHPQLSGVIIADDQGREYFLMRDGDGWLVRERGPGDAGRIRWQAPNGKAVDWEENDGYDPRNRTWFRDAVNAIGSGRVSWSRPYVFFTRQVPGITASVAWQQGSAVWVVALDVDLSTILSSIDALQIADNGKGFLFRADGSLYVPPVVAQERERLQPSHFFSPENTQGGTLAIDAVDAWKNSGKPEGGALQFSSGDRSWWGGFAPLYADDEAAWLGVALPLDDLFTLLQRRWQLVLIIALVVLVSAMLLVLLVVRKFSRRLKELPRLSIDRERFQEDIVSLIHIGENMHLEFKSTMRMNLRSGKAGKEIELAWLKGVAAFMNTEGGILLIGVDDDGNIVGLDADQFDNEDKIRLHFKNLFNQHVGPEFSKYVRFEIYKMENRRSVIAIESERAGDPVFLVDRKKESFYIRSGPSNLELSISQALSYLRRRF